MDFDPSFWGPFTWKMLFVFVLSYPPSNPDYATRRYYHMFLSSLQGVLPCDKCRKSVKLYTAAKPLEPALVGRVELLKWLVDLFNNKRPPNVQIHNLEDLRRVIKPDPSIAQVLTRMRRRHPKLKF